MVLQLSEGGNLHLLLRRTHIKITTFPVRVEVIPRTKFINEDWLELFLLELNILAIQTTFAESRFKKNYLFDSDVILTSVKL